MGIRRDSRPGRGAGVGGGGPERRGGVNSAGSRDDTEPEAPMPAPEGSEQAAIISEFSGDPEMMELIGEYVGNLRASAEALQAAHRSHDLGLLARLAHQVRGSAAGYGFPQLGLVAGALEDRIRGSASSDAGEIAAEVTRLTELCRRAAVSR